MKIRISTRVVFLTKRYAVKIPIDRRGWLQGINERKLWSKYKSPNLVPLVWGFGGIVCQKRASKPSTFRTKYVAHIKREIPELDVLNCDLYNNENWGIYKGRLVLIDYGITEQISKMY